MYETGIAVELFEVHRNCSQQRFNFYVDIAENLISEVPTVDNVAVYYEPYDDYMIIEFDKDGSHYRMQGYKIFAVTKDKLEGYIHGRHFNNHIAFIDFFLMNKDREWKG